MALPGSLQNGLRQAIILPKLRAREPAAMGAVLVIVWRAIAGHLLKKADLTRAPAKAVACAGRETGWMGEIQDPAEAGAGSG